MNDRRRPGGGSAPRAASPAVAVAVALIAAILGFLILKQFNSSDKSSTKTPSASGSTASTLAGGAPVETTTAAVPTTAAVTRGLYKVVVANASGVNKAAAAMTENMKKLNFVMLPPTNPLADYPKKSPVTRIFYDVNSAAQGQDVATVFNVAPEVMPATGPPISAESFAGANVVVMLGIDWANKALPGTVPTTVAGGVPVSIPAAPTTPSTAAP